MKLRLEIEVEYEHSEDPSQDIGVYRQSLDGILLYIAQNAAANGLMTGILHEIEVADWSAKVVGLDV